MNISILLCVFFFWFCFQFHLHFVISNLLLCKYNFFFFCFVILQFILILLQLATLSIFFFNSLKHFLNFKGTINRIFTISRSICVQKNIKTLDTLLTTNSPGDCVILWLYYTFWLIRNDNQKTL